MEKKPNTFNGNSRELPTQEKSDLKIVNTSHVLPSVYNTPCNEQIIEDATRSPLSQNENLSSFSSITSHENEVTLNNGSGISAGKEIQPSYMLQEEIQFEKPLISTTYHKDNIIQCNLLHTEGRKMFVPKSPERSFDKANSLPNIEMAHGKNEELNSKQNNENDISTIKTKPERLKKKFDIIEDLRNDIKKIDLTEALKKVDLLISIMGEKDIKTDVNDTKNTDEPNIMNKLTCNGLPYSIHAYSAVLGKTEKMSKNQKSIRLDSLKYLSKEDLHSNSIETKIVVTGDAKLKEDLNTTTTSNKERLKLTPILFSLQPYHSGKSKNIHDMGNICLEGTTSILKHSQFPYITEIDTQLVHLPYIANHETIVMNFVLEDDPENVGNFRNNSINQKVNNNNNKSNNVSTGTSSESINVSVTMSDKNLATIHNDSITSYRSRIEDNKHERNNNSNNNESNSSGSTYTSVTVSDVSTEDESSRTSHSSTKESNYQDRQNSNDKSNNTSTSTSSVSINAVSDEQLTTKDEDSRTSHSFRKESNNLQRNNKSDVSSYQTGASGSINASPIVSNEHLTTDSTTQQSTREINNNGNLYVKTASEGINVTNEHEPTKDQDSIHSYASSKKSNKQEINTDNNNINNYYYPSETEVPRLSSNKDTHREVMNEQIHTNNHTDYGTKESQAVKHEAKEPRKGTVTKDNIFIQNIEYENSPYKSRIAVQSGKAKNIEAQQFDIKRDFGNQISNSEEILGVHTVNLMSQFRRPNSTKKAKHKFLIESEGFKKTYTQGYGRKYMFLQIINGFSSMITSKVIKETNEMLQKLNNFFKHDSKLRGQTLLSDKDHGDKWISEKKEVKKEQYKCTQTDKDFHLSLKRQNKEKDRTSKQTKINNKESLHYFQSEHQPEEIKGVQSIKKEKDVLPEQKNTSEGCICEKRKESLHPPSKNQTEEGCFCKKREGPLNPQSKHQREEIKVVPSRMNKKYLLREQKKTSQGCICEKREGPLYPQSKHQTEEGCICEKKKKSKVGALLHPQSSQSKLQTRKTEAVQPKEETVPIAEQKRTFNDCICESCIDCSVVVSENNAKHQISLQKSNSFSKNESTGGNILVKSDSNRVKNSDKGNGPDQLKESTISKVKENNDNNNMQSSDKRVIKNKNEDNTESLDDLIDNDNPIRSDKLTIKSQENTIDKVSQEQPLHSSTNSEGSKQASAQDRAEAQNTENLTAEINSVSPTSVLEKQLDTKPSSRASIQSDPSLSESILSSQKSPRNEQQSTEGEMKNPIIYNVETIATAPEEILYGPNPYFQAEENGIHAETLMPVAPQQSTISEESTLSRPSNKQSNSIPVHISQLSRSTVYPKFLNSMKHSNDEATKKNQHRIQTPTSQSHNLYTIRNNEYDYTDLHNITKQKHPTVQYWSNPDEYMWHEVPKMVHYPKHVLRKFDEQQSFKQVEEEKSEEEEEAAVEEVEGEEEVDEEEEEEEESIYETIGEKKADEEKEVEANKYNKINQALRNKSFNLRKNRINYFSSDSQSLDKAKRIQSTQQNDLIMTAIPENVYMKNYEVSNNIRSELQQMKHTSAVGCGLGCYICTSNGLVFDTCNITKHNKSHVRSNSKISETEENSLVTHHYKMKNSNESQSADYLGNIHKKVTKLQRMYDLVNVESSCPNSKYDIQYLRFSERKENLQKNNHLQNEQKPNQYEKIGKPKYRHMLFKMKEVSLDNTSSISSSNTEIQTESSEPSFDIIDDEYMYSDYFSSKENVWKNSLPILTLDQDREQRNFCHNAHNNIDKLQNFRLPLEITQINKAHLKHSSQFHAHMHSRTPFRKENMNINQNTELKIWKISEGECKDKFFTTDHPNNHSTLPIIHHTTKLADHQTTMENILYSRPIMNRKSQRVCNLNKKGLYKGEDKSIPCTNTSTNEKYDCKIGNDIAKGIYNKSIPNNRALCPIYDYRSTNLKKDCLENIEEKEMKNNFITRKYKNQNDSLECFNRQIFVYPVKTNKNIKESKKNDNKNNISKNKNVNQEEAVPEKNKKINDLDTDPKGVKSDMTLESQQEYKTSENVSNTGRPKDESKSSLKEETSFEELKPILSPQTKLKAEGTKSNIKAEESRNYEGELIVNDKNAKRLTAQNKGKIVVKSGSKYKSNLHKSNQEKLKNKPNKCFAIFSKIFSKKPKQKKSARVLSDTGLIELHMADSQIESILSERFSIHETSSFAGQEQLKIPDQGSKFITAEDEKAVTTHHVVWPDGTPEELIMLTRNMGATTVKASDITQTLQQGFRSDCLSLSRDRCFRKNVLPMYGINLSSMLSPEDFMAQMGYSFAATMELLSDKDFEGRLKAAIREAGIWTHTMNKCQAALLVYLAYEASPKIMTYYLQLVEAVANQRICDAWRLDGFLQMMENIEDGSVTLIEMYGENMFEDPDEDKRSIAAKLNNIYLRFYKMAKEQAQKIDIKVSARGNRLLKYLTAVIMFKPMLARHMELLAHYIGQNKIKSILQTEAAVIYLSKVNIKTVDINEFEEICGITEQETKK